MTFTEEQGRWITGTLGIMQFPDRELPRDSEEPRDGERNTKGRGWCSCGKTALGKSCLGVPGETGLSSPHKKGKITVGTMSYSLKERWTFMSNNKYL